LVSVHLIHDLQPYHCTFERCHDANRIYGTRQEWLEHESLHTRVWHCAAHGEEFETQPEYTAHVHESHPEHKEEHFSPELVAAAVGPSMRLHRDCPFCPTAFSEASELQKHIIFHLERLALLAFPADDEDGAERSERASDSHQGQRRGRVGSVEVDFADEEQLLIIENLGWVELAPAHTGTKTVMAGIQEAVGQRGEEAFLTQWLADSEGADADPFQVTDEPRRTSFAAPELPPPHEPSVPDKKGRDEFLSGPHFPSSQSNAISAIRRRKEESSLYVESVKEYEGLEELLSIPAAPVEEHFPYLSWRSREENFNYRPHFSVVRELPLWTGTYTSGPPTYVDTVYTAPDWETMPRHHHPTRISDVLEEAEK
jgi:hypothetical protein